MPRLDLTGHRLLVAAHRAATQVPRPHSGSASPRLCSTSGPGNTTSGPRQPGPPPVARVEDGQQAGCCPAAHAAVCCDAAEKGCCCKSPAAAGDCGCRRYRQGNRVGWIRQRLAQHWGRRCPAPNPHPTRPPAAQSGADRLLPHRTRPPRHRNRLPPAQRPLCRLRRSTLTSTYPDRLDSKIN